MLFYIVDDDEAVCSMLAEIIEDENLGQVVGYVEDGSLINSQFLTLKSIDILLIDLLMPKQDGMETIQQIKPSYKGKIVMISQVESKELIGKAYSYGIEYYIIKPINKFEVISVLTKVIERIRLERSIFDIHKSLSDVLKVDTPALYVEKEAFNFAKKHILAELGLMGENGYQDLVDILNFLLENEESKLFRHGFPPLKEIFAAVVQQKLEKSRSQVELNREIKASEQRVRRIIIHCLNHLASLGLTDFANPIFEQYAAKLFDFIHVRERMLELEQGQLTENSRVRIQTKKFIQALFFEVKRLVAESTR